MPVNLKSVGVVLLLRSGKYFELNSFNLGKVRRKHFSPFHKQDRKIFVFPNTKQRTLHIPPGFKLCKNLDSFKVKSSKRDFKRCTQDISNRGIYMRNDPSHLDRVLEPRSQEIQLELTSMAITLLESIPRFKIDSIHKENSEQRGNGPNLGRLALDIGCGRGICLQHLVTRGYTCIGVDLDLFSLSCFKNNKNNVSWINSSSEKQTTEKEMSVFLTAPADVVRWDMRHGLPFRDNTFDVVISISFLQWLFHGIMPNRQLDSFYLCLWKVLCPNGAAVIQFYPRNQRQLSMAVTRAMDYFEGALIGDYPHIDRGRKLFLLLIKPKFI